VWAVLAARSRGVTDTHGGGHLKWRTFVRFIELMALPVELVEDCGLGELARGLGDSRGAPLRSFTSPSLGSTFEVSRSVGALADAADERTGMSEPPAAPTSDTSSRWHDVRRLFGTWPRRIAGLFVAAIVGWSVTYFGPALWHKGTELIGVAPSAVDVEVVLDVDRFADPQLGRLPDLVWDVSYLIPRPLREITAPPPGGAFTGQYRRWAHELGGVERATRFRVVVRGESASPVVLQRLRVEVNERRPPLDALVIVGDASGPYVSTRFFLVDLDEEAVTYFGKAGRAQVFPLFVTNAELEVLDVVGKTHRCDCSWTLWLDYTADNEQGSLRIDEGGEPFRTAAPAPSSDYYDWDGNWRQYPTG
jgi:hypothetical protein